MVDTVLKTLKVSQRRACRVLGQARTTQRHSSNLKDDEERLVARITELATRYARYGYRPITLDSFSFDKDLASALLILN